MAALPHETKKVLQIIIGNKITYHVSVNPNNGELTHVSDCSKAEIFISDWDMTFIPRIEEHYKRKYPKSSINIINTK